LDGDEGNLLILCRFFEATYRYCAYFNQDLLISRVFDVFKCFQYDFTPAMAQIIWK